MIPYIDTDFQTAIEKHIFGNLIIQNTKSPLIMGIFGPMGEGKTFQLEYVLLSLGVDIIPISPSELENADAGAPAQLLRDLYKKAGQATQPTALVINDIDTVLGRWGDLTQYTMNRQLVYGQLQNFCDEPCSVAGQKLDEYLFLSLETIHLSFTSR